MLRISYKSELYFCLIHKKKSEIDFFLFSYFKNRKFNLEDTSLHFTFNVIHQGNLYGSSNVKASLVNEIYKEFEKEDSYNTIQSIVIDLNINREKNYLRFFINDEYLTFCGTEENSLEKKYFESALTNLSFFEAMFSD